VDARVAKAVEANSKAAQRALDEQRKKSAADLKQASVLLMCACAFGLLGESGLPVGWLQDELRVFKRTSTGAWNRGARDSVVRFQHSVVVYCTIATRPCLWICACR
jgi:hypothetical protein